MSLLKSLLPSALALAAAFGAAAPAHADETAPARVDFVAMGPLPVEAAEAGAVLRAAAAEAPELALQLGLAGSGAGCSPAELSARLDRLDRIDAPVLVLPGKGDRQACAMALGRPFAPLEAHRAAVHDTPWLSRGARKVVTRSDWENGNPEFALVLRRGVAFVMAGDGDAEAAADWIGRALAQAKAEGAGAAVVALPSDPAAPGMEAAAAALAAAAADPDMPVLALHPDHGPGHGLSVQPGEAGAPLTVGIPAAAGAGPTSVSVTLGARAPFSISVTPPLGARTADGGLVAHSPDHG